MCLSLNIAETVAVVAIFGGSGGVTIAKSLNKRWSEQEIVKLSKGNANYVRYR